jgi:hypothetical protein
LGWPHLRTGNPDNPAHNASVFSNRLDIFVEHNEVPKRLAYQSRRNNSAGYKILGLSIQNGNRRSTGR